MVLGLQPQHVTGSVCVVVRVAESIIQAQFVSSSRWVSEECKTAMLAASASSSLDSNRQQTEVDGVTLVPAKLTLAGTDRGPVLSWEGCPVGEEVLMLLLPGFLVPQVP